MHSFTFFFLDLKSWTATQSLVLKKGNSAALFQADSFESFQMLATVRANIKVDS